MDLFDLNETDAKLLILEFSVLNVLLSSSCFPREYALKKSNCVKLQSLKEITKYMKNTNSKIELTLIEWDIFIYKNSREKIILFLFAFYN
jgi:hypothetical protein